MTSRKVDQLLLIVGVVLIFISSYQLFFPRQNQFGNGLTLGTLAQSEAVVKIKNSMALDWKDAFKGSELSEKQLIYTDDNSSAEIQFLQGNSVQVGENSLIRLSTFGQTSGLDVERGIIRARIEGNRPLVVEVNGSPLTLSGQDADVQINLQGESGEIGVLKGEVSVEREGEVKELNQSTSLKVTENEFKTQKVPFTLESPQNGENIFILDDFKEITFKWQPSEKGTVILSQHPKFKDPQSFNGGGVAMTTLLPGTYYWKVENEEGSSLTGHFALIKEVAPTPLRPLQGEVLSMPHDLTVIPRLFLQWKASTSDAYQLEWHDGEPHSKMVQGGGASVELLRSGPFKWRVKLAKEGRPLAPWSAWQEVTIDLVLPPTVPTDLSPSELELQSYTKEVHEVELSWSSSAAVELELTPPQGQKEIQTLSEKSYTVKAQAPGLYRWRVRATDKFSRASEWSELKSFEVIDLSHEIAAGAQRIELKRPDQAVTFNWQGAAESSSVFELSESKDFSDPIVKKEVKGDQVRITIPKTGSYYWRSRQFNPDGTFHVTEPRKVIIEPSPAPGKPERLPDLEVPLKWKETRLQRSWMDFFISRAFADELKGFATVTIPPHEDAKKYVIRIYRDPEAKNLVLEKITDKSAFEWQDVKPGLYFWHFAVIDHWDRQTPFSDLSTLKIVGEPPVYPEKPRLLRPIRAVELAKGEEIEFKWRDSKRNEEYLLEVSPDKEFRRIILQIKIKGDAFDWNARLKSGLYYWRLHATNKTNRTVLSNRGRFQIVAKPPLERIQIADQRGIWKKKYKNRWSLAWAPSMDSYSFEEGEQKGKIDGTALNGVEAKALYLTEQWVFGAEVLRQSGKVFESESYLFQRILLEGGWRKNVGQALWSFGLLVGQTSANSYSISDETVSAQSVSGLSYGPMVRGHFAFGPKWEIQSRVTYLAGEIGQMEIGGEALREMGSFHLLGGVGYALRSYSDNEGSQSSLKLTLGLAREF